MCELVKDETERVDSRVLEPACGDGNFLAEILKRKLNTVSKLDMKDFIHCFCIPSGGPQDREGIQ